MKRREFITLLGGAAAAWPLAARAQQAERMRRIAVLLGWSESNPEYRSLIDTFVQGLAQLGWVSGRNVLIDVRWTRGDVRRMQILVKELVELQPDVILCQSTPVTAALQRETRTIPIVFVIVADPVGSGFVAGLSHPGGNITGFLTSESAITGKMFELLTEIAPGLRRVAMLFNPDTAPGGGTYYFRDFEAAARSTKVEPIAARARSDSEIELVVTSLAGEPGGGLIVMPDYFMFIHSRPIILLAARNNVPTIYPWRSTVVRDSGLLSYGPDLGDIVRRGAVYVDRILRGEKPADLPVQVPVKFEMAVNARTAKALGLDVPATLLAIADEVIE